MIIGKEHEGNKWLKYAENINEAINTTLWDAERKCYLLGITEDGRQRKSALLWFELMPAFINSTWDRKTEDTFQYLKKTSYNKDPKISCSWWNSDYSFLLDKKESPCFNYSGIGPAIGVSPVIIELLLRAGYLKMAAEQMDIITNFTSDENNLIPEHINTIHPGKLGNYNVYPKPYYYVDSGNLLHLSFFLTMITAIIGRDNINKNILWPKLPENIRLLEVENLKMRHGVLSYQYEINGNGCKMTVSPSESMDLVVYLQSNHGNKLFVNGNRISDFQTVETYSKEVRYLKLNVKIEKETVITIKADDTLL